MSTSDAGAGGGSGGVLSSPELAANGMLQAVAAGSATLARGASSDAVRAVQEALKALGQAVTPDGSFGPKTAAALVALQASAKLPQTGILDAATLAVLDQRLQQKRGPTLQQAIAQAAGATEVAASGPAPGAVAGRGPSAHDVGFFTDGDALAGTGEAPADDPDTPAPAVDSLVAGPSAATGTPLPADRRPLFDSVQRALQGDQAGLAALDRLLAAGRLTSGTLLPNLATMARTPRDPRLVTEGGTEPWRLLAGAIRQIENPLRVQQGRGHGTCGAGTLEYLLLRRDPGEFVRLLDGITRPANEVALRSGKTFKLPRTAFARDDSGRIDVDRLFQSALMNHATAMSWIFDYDNPDDNDSFWAAVNGDTRVPLFGLTSLYGAIMGESYTSASTILRSSEAVAADVAAAAQKGQLVPVILQFGGGLHWLTLEKVERGGDGKPAGVILRNPWGRDDGSGAPPRTPLPEGGGRIRMKYADFAAALNGATLRS